MKYVDENLFVILEFGVFFIIIDILDNINVEENLDF